MLWDLLHYVEVLRKMRGVGAMNVARLLGPDFHDSSFSMDKSPEFSNFRVLTLSAQASRWITYFSLAQGTHG